MTWSPSAFDPVGICTCTRRHSPPQMVVETHHMLPLSWGGGDVADNKVRVCPNTHYGTHALLNEYVHHGGPPPPTVLTGFTTVARWLAAYAWQHRPPGHPTPFWSPAHVHVGRNAGDVRT